MQFFHRLIFITFILNSSECTLFDRIYFDSAMNGDVLFGLNASTTPLKILFNLGEVVNEKEPDHVVIRDGGVDTVYSESTHLSVSRWTDECIVVNYSSNHQTKLIASVNYTGAYMYGRAGDYEPGWPMNSSVDYVYFEEVYVSKGSYHLGVVEPYWLLSNGYYVYVDNRVPLFVKMNHKNIFQLIAEKKLPYIKSQKLALNFAICKLSDVTHAQQHAIQNFLGKPSTLPDVRLVTYPVWSTVSTDPKKIIHYAKDIAEQGLAGLLRIDGAWEECTGSLTPRSSFFPFKNLMSELKKLNFSVALVIDALVGYKCNDTYDDGIKNNYFVRNDKNDTSINGKPDGKRFIDLTNPGAQNWYLSRLRHLREIYGIDSFKFDKSFSDFPPQPPIYHTMTEDHPETIVKESAKVLATLGSIVQMNAARNIQRYGFFVRMPYYYPSWEQDSNLFDLRNCIPTLLQLNIVGYSFVVPRHLVGYSDTFRSPELFIRWTQLMVFMPTMEFAIPHREFDDELVNITKKLFNLHARYSGYIIQLMEENVKTGAPVNRPLWWLAPNDEEALKCGSEFLLGDNILVAPILEKGARSRDIYLPQGRWRDETNNQLIDGPKWLNNYPAGLDVLPYFRREKEDGY